MSILSELNEIISAVYPVETGMFSKTPPDEFCVLTPMNDMFDLHADNVPLIEVNSVRISVFSKKNYIAKVRQVKKMLLLADFFITDSQFIEREDDTGYYHYEIDVQKDYNFSLIN